MPIIYHVTTASEWKAAQEMGFYETASLKALERYFSGQEHLIKLVIDTTKLTSRYVQEWSPSTQDTFPHIYGPINLEAVVDVVAI